MTSENYYQRSVGESIFATVVGIRLTTSLNSFVLFRFQGKVYNLKVKFQGRMQDFLTGGAASTTFLFLYEKQPFSRTQRPITQLKRKRLCLKPTFPPFQLLYRLPLHASKKHSVHEYTFLVQNSNAFCQPHHRN